MANGLLEKKSLEDIAAAIRVKNGKTTKYKASQMADAIMELKLGGSVIVSNEVSEVYVIDGKTVINVPKTEKEPEVGDYIIAQTKNGNDYDAAVFKIDAVDKDTDVDNYICNVTVSDTLDVIGVDSSDATALATDIMKGKTAYVNNVKVIGTLEAKTSVEFKNAVIGNLEDIETGEYEGFNLSLTNELTNSEVINSSTSLSTVVSKSILTNADPNLKAENIVTGKEIFGITGNGGAAGGVDTTDADAVATNIESGKTAYINNVKVTGTLPVIENGNEITATNSNVVTATETDGVSVLLKSDAKRILEQGAGIKTTISNTNLVDLINGTVPANATLKAENIKSGVSVLGITGTFTSDANAVALDIEEGKTAYVNGTKVTGTCPAVGSINFRTDNFVITQPEGIVKIKTNYVPTASDTEKFIINTSSNIFMEVPTTKMATSLGITADKIKKGVTILGVTGTFEATDDKEQQITDLTAEVARLQAIIDGYENLNDVEF